MTMRRLTFTASGLILALVMAAARPGFAQEQVAHAEPAAFEPSTESAEARAAFEQGLETWIRFRTAEGIQLYERALELDPDFALPRALGVSRLPFAERGAELDAATASATDGHVEELLLIAAAREAHRGNMQAARALRLTAAELTQDRRVRLYAAWTLPTDERKPILRALLEEHPDFAPAAAALAWAIVPNVFATVTDTDLAEAEASARNALRQESDRPYTHLVLAQVLTRKGDRPEARAHLGHATASPTYLSFAHQLLAQMDVQDGRLAEAREVLESALAVEESEPIRRGLREAIALTRLHEGDLEATYRGYEAIAADAEAGGFQVAAGGYYATAAIIASGADDAAAFDRYRAEAEARLPETSSVEWLIIGPALLGRADDAAAALDRYLAATAGNRSVAAEESRERMRGYVELARDRPTAAIEHFQRAGRNPYSQLGLWEAHRQLGNEAEATALREDLMTRKDFSLFSTATPTARYRARRID